MALVAMCARAAVVIFLLVVMVSGSASARITAPTSDYNNLDTPDSADLVDTPSPSTPASSGEVAAASDEASSLVPWTVGAMRMLRRVYLECRDDDLGSCLKVQVIHAMDRVARSTRKVSLGAGVTLERDSDAPEQGAAVDDLEQTLPRSLPERERSLDKLILEKLFGFLQNYSLRLKLPSVAELNGAVGAAGEDARRRRQPFGGMMGLGMLLAGSLLPMKFGMLAMLAGKALMLSKLALLISALMAMRNMGAGGGSSGGGSAHH